MSDFKSLRLCVNHRAGNTLPSCGARGALELRKLLESALQSRNDAGVPVGIPLETVHCLGKCHIGPTLRLVPAGPFLMGVQTQQDVEELLDLLTTGKIEEAAERFPEPSVS